ncbi:MAG: C-GCAxxG-C-C family (seleno)protein [Candidatus Omnitrophota bacterium]
MKASVFYRGTEGYNCAQAILKAFQEKYNLSEEMIKSLSDSGHGKARGGMCGALFAALRIAHSNSFAEIKKRFADEAGSVFCKEIRKLNQLSCGDCVDLASKALSEIDSKK